MHHGAFKRWCYLTKAERASGKVKIWQIRGDILNDGNLETMVRLDHASDSTMGPYCSYYDNQQMLIDLHNPVARAAYARPLYSLTSTLGNDLIYDAVSKRYYILEWNRDGPAYAEAENVIIPDYHGIPRKGAKASVMVYLPRKTGPDPICWINWVPVNKDKR